MSRGYDEDGIDGPWERAMAAPVVHLGEVRARKRLAEAQKLADAQRRGIDRALTEGERLFRIAARLTRRSAELVADALAARVELVPAAELPQARAPGDICADPGCKHSRSLHCGEVLPGIAVVCASAGCPCPCFDEGAWP